MVKKHGYKQKNNALIWQIGTLVFAVLFVLSVSTSMFGGSEPANPSVTPNGNGNVEPTMPSGEGDPVVTILNDARCIDCTSFAQQVAVQLTTLFPDMTVVEVDYSTDEGQKLFADSELTNLPAFLFAEDVQSLEGYSDIQQYMVAQGDYESLQIGASFDPTAEICTNGIDDTGNGLVDCEDPTCAETLECRELKENHLAVFIMSDCPYGKEAVKALAPLVESMPDLEYDINYIVTDNGDGTFRSLHGEYEVEENIRQLCALEEGKEKFFDYTLCRSENGVRGVDWEDCADEAGLDKTALEECVTGDLGKELLSENAKIAQALGIGASPTWIANNRYQFSGITSDVVQSNVCKYNPDLEGCDAVLSSEASVPEGQC